MLLWSRYLYPKTRIPHSTSRWNFSLSRIPSSLCFEISETSKYIFHKWPVMITSVSLKHRENLRWRGFLAFSFTFQSALVSMTLANRLCIFWFLSWPVKEIYMHSLVPGGRGYSSKFWIGVRAAKVLNPNPIKGLRKRKLIPFLRPKSEKWHPIQGY